MPDGLPTNSSSGGRAVEELTRHSQHRRAGWPTLSVLVGCAGPSEAVFKMAADQAGYRSLHCTIDHSTQVVASVIEVIAEAFDLPRHALVYLQWCAGRTDADDDPPHTQHDLDQLIHASGAETDPRGSIAVAAALLRRSAGGYDANGDLLKLLDRALSGSTARPGWRVLGAIDGLLESTHWPALFVKSGLNAGDAAWLERIAGALGVLAETVPGWMIGIALGEADFAAFCRGAPDSRAKSLLMAGEVRISVDHPGPNDPALIPSPSATACPPPPQAILSAATVRPDIMEAYRAAARLQPRQDDQARSAAERLLFELLESQPQTRGRFVLNGSPGFPFGPRPAEIDLLAKALRLAVEVDGYYHFTDPDRYRRDRRKDWELQRHGYRVVRVLAEDVVMRAQDVLELILRAVDHCIQPIDGEDMTNDLTR